jgi:hypothetical protein
VFLKSPKIRFQQPKYSLGIPCVHGPFRNGVINTICARFGTGHKFNKVIEGDWLVLVRQPVFVRMMLAGALVLGSHAMHDAFAIIRWRDAGVSAAVSNVLWSESVGAEVLVFVLLGPWLLILLGRRGGIGFGASSGGAQKAKKNGCAGRGRRSHFRLLLSYQPQAGPTPIPTGPIPIPKLMPGA